MTSYRECFQDEAAGSRYDDDQYSPGGYWGHLWSIERALLERIAARVRAEAGTLTHLDFACGTGRVLAALEASSDLAVGVDVSDPMLVRARQRATRARLVRADLTVDASAIEGRFTLVTAFRFVLNAESELRRGALRALRPLLDGPHARLVVNNHGRIPSYKSITGAVKAASFRAGVGPRPDNVLRGDQMRELVQREGFTIEEEHGIGVLPAALIRVAGARRGQTLDRFLSAGPCGARWGVDQLLVCKVR